MFKVPGVRAALAAFGGSFGLSFCIAAPLLIIVVHTDVSGTIEAALEVSVVLFVMEFPIMAALLLHHKNNRRG